jgi:hypothetical protein
MDFDDGLGYRPVAPGAVLTAQYASYGLKRLRYRVALPNGKVLVGQTAIFISAPQTAAAVEDRSGNTGYNPAPVFLTNRPGFPTTDSVYWWPGNLCDDQIRKPLIVVSGFDPAFCMLQKQRDKTGLTRKVGNRACILSRWPTGKTDGRTG